MSHILSIVPSCHDCLCASTSRMKEIIVISNSKNGEPMQEGVRSPSISATPKEEELQKKDESCGGDNTTNWGIFADHVSCY